MTAQRTEAIKVLVIVQCLFQSHDKIMPINARKHLCASASVFLKTPGCRNVRNDAQPHSPWQMQQAFVRRSASAVSSAFLRSASWYSWNSCRMLARSSTLNAAAATKIVHTKARREHE